MRARLTRQGIALVTTMLMLPIMVLLGLSLTSIGVSDLGSTRSVERTKQAVYLSEAGREEGLRQLLRSAAYSAPNGVNLHLDAGNVTYYCWNNAGGSSVMTASNQVQIRPGFAYILSEASVNNITRRSSVLVKLVIPSPYQGAATGLQSVAIGNGYTDSYNSDNISDPRGHAEASLGSNGHVNTNVETNGITIGSNGNIHGNQAHNANIDAPAATLPSGIAPGVITNNWSELGDWDNDPNTPPTIQVFTKYSPGSYSSPLSISGQSKVLLDAGDDANATQTYIFPSISMSGQAQLGVRGTGKVKVYIDGGDLSIGGNGLANLSMKPRNLEIKMVGDGNVSLHGGGNSGAAFFKLYAPESDVTISGNMHLFGAVIGKTIGFNGNSGAGITYDEAPEDDEIIPPTAVNWQRF